MRLSIVMSAILVAQSALAISLYECACFEECQTSWSLFEFEHDDCVMSNSVGIWASAELEAEDWGHYLVTLAGC